jgi:hypothetical protein
LDQQKALSVDIRHLDQKIRDIKQDMAAILYKKNPDYKPDEIEKIFHRYDNAAGNVSQTLDKAKNQH